MPICQKYDVQTTIKSNGGPINNRYQAGMDIKHIKVSTDMIINQIEKDMLNRHHEGYQADNWSSNNHGIASKQSGQAI